MIRVPPVNPTAYSAFVADPHNRQTFKSFLLSQPELCNGSDLKLGLKYLDGSPKPFPDKSSLDPIEYVRAVEEHLSLRVADYKLRTIREIVGIVRPIAKVGEKKYWQICDAIRECVIADDWNGVPVHQLPFRMSVEQLIYALGF